MGRRFAMFFAVVMTGLSIGCSGQQAPPPTGFLSDYSQLKENDGAHRFISPKMKTYSSFMVDPVEMQASKSLNSKEAAEVAQYFNDTFAKELNKHGYRVVNRAGPDVARIRVAMTSIKESTWWMNLHPASKLTGAGTGGASMEGEVIDSVTGEQLAAVIQVGKGNQFELDTFSKLDDVKDAIDAWVGAAVKRLDQLRSNA